MASIYQVWSFVFFVCHAKISKFIGPHCILGTLEKPLANKGAPRWFCNVFTYGTKFIGYWIILWNIFFLKLKTQNCMESGVHFLCCSKAPYAHEKIQQLIVFRCKAWEILNLETCFQFKSF